MFYLWNRQKLVLYNGASYNSALYACHFDRKSRHRYLSTGFRDRSLITVIWVALAFASALYTFASYTDHNHNNINDNNNNGNNNNNKKISANFN